VVKRQETQFFCVSYFLTTSQKSFFAVLSFCDPILSEYLHPLKAREKQQLSGGIPMQIKLVNNIDIPKWLELSSEYDCYVKESVPNLTEWYEGNGDSPAFDTYMQSKINQQEAFMAVDSHGGCLGIIAISKKNNRITFFGVTHKANFQMVGHALFSHVFEFLDDSKSIYINEIISSSAWIKQHRELYLSLGFIFSCNSVENGVSVNTFKKLPSSR